MVVTQTPSLLLVLALLVRCGDTQSCKPTNERNLAQGRCARQSSVFPYEIIGKACKAVNGNCDGDFGHASCTHTQRDMEPWWYVDLGDQYAISTVVVKNREDCCSERLRGAEIRVGESLANHGKSNSLCGRITHTAPGSITTIYCNGQRGRYVTVFIPGRAEHLTLCEVEVYGSKQGGQGQASAAGVGGQQQ